MHRFFMRVSTGMAILGGIVLSALVIMVVISIAGRETGIGPITGDFELVEAGIAFSIFAFLPLTQISGGHAVVDVFTNWLPDRASRILSMLIDIAFAIVLVIIAVQIFKGTADKLHRGQVTFLLQFPLWWAYALSAFAAAIGAIVSVYVALLRIYEAFTGHVIAPAGAGAEH